jgi:hypothetical protein
MPPEGTNALFDSLFHESVVPHQLDTRPNSEADEHSRSLGGPNSMGDTVAYFIGDNLHVYAESVLFRFKYILRRLAFQKFEDIRCSIC